MITNARGVFSEPIAEYVLMMILAVIRRLPQLLELQREHTWQPLSAREMRDVTVGVVGLGSIGRAVARFIIGTLAVVITIAVGALFFKLPLSAVQVDWGLFALTMALGLVSLLALGVAIGTWTISIRSEPWFVGEGFAAAFYLFSGAIYPISLLPTWLQPIGFALPITYWLELVRRSLLGQAAADAYPTFAAWSNGDLLLALAGITVVLIGLAAMTFNYFDHLARERGLIDVTSNF